MTWLLGCAALLWYFSFLVQMILEVLDSSSNGSRHPFYCPNSFMMGAFVTERTFIWRNNLMLFHSVPKPKESPQCMNQKLVAAPLKNFAWGSGESTVKSLKATFRRGLMIFWLNFVCTVELGFRDNRFSDYFSKEHFSLHKIITFSDNLVLFKLFI